MEKALLLWRQDPIQAVKDLFGATPEDYQGEMLLDLFVRGHDRLAAKSAHGTGKTTTLAWAGSIFLMTRPIARVVATAPVQAQLKDVLWPEFSKWMSKMPEQFAQMWDLSAEHIRHKERPNDWFAVARTSNKPENLQGFHNTFLLFLIDEASAVPAPVFEVIEGALSDVGAEGGESKLMMAGNPNFAGGELFDAFGKNKGLYQLYTLSGDPETEFTVRDGRAFVSKRVTAKYRQTIGRKYGFSSPVYDIRVRGQFPRMDMKAVFPLEWLERAQYFPLPSFDPVADGVIVCCDPARDGLDETTVCVRRKNAIIYLEGRRGLSTVESAAWVNAVCEQYEEEGIQVLDLRVDEPGVGGGVIDALRAPKDAPEGQISGFGRAVTAYNGGRALIQGVDPDDEIRMFLNRRARDHWVVRRKLELCQIVLPVDEEMVAQGASIHFEAMEHEKVKVESKKAMKARLGPDASPDKMDVIVLAFADSHSMADEITAFVSEADVVQGEERAILDQRFM